MNTKHQTEGHVLISQLEYFCIPTRLSTGEHVTIKYYDITMHSRETSEATE
jgi:hypothetical protein